VHLQGAALLVVKLLQRGCVCNLKHSKAHTQRDTQGAKEGGHKLGNVRTEWCNVAR
jgi:hypothetical protein